MEAELSVVGHWMQAICEDDCGPVVPGLVCGVIDGGGYAQGWDANGSLGVYEWTACGDFCFELGSWPWAERVYITPASEGWKVEALGQAVTAVPGCEWIVGGE